jgi:hypothetical protein
MKKLIIPVLGLAVFITACSTSSQRTEYNTIATIEQTASTAIDGYYTLVIKGVISTNGVPTVSKAFNDLQASAALAATIASSGTNALAPSSLVLEASQLGSLISTLETK